MTLTIGADFEEGTVFGELSAATSSPHGEALWTQMLSAISSAVESSDKVNSAVAVLEQRGVDCSTVRAQHAAWMDRLSELFRIIVRIIANNSAVQAAIDAAAAVVDYAERIVGLGEAEPTVVRTRRGVWRDIIHTLNPDRQRVVPGLAGFGELGWVGVVVPAIVRAWPTIWPILWKVAQMVATYVITDRAADAIQSLSGDVAARGKALAACLDRAKGFTDKAQAQAVLNTCQNVSTSVSGMNWLLIGGAAGALGLLYFQLKGKR